MYNNDNLADEKMPMKIILGGKVLMAGGGPNQPFSLSLSRHKLADQL
ncbi:MAG: hypothetical protein ABJH20_07980 [Rhizobiaceae bacterium]